MNDFDHKHMLGIGIYERALVMSVSHVRLVSLCRECESFRMLRISGWFMRISACQELSSVGSE